MDLNPEKLISMGNWTVTLKSLTGETETVLARRSLRNLGMNLISSRIVKLLCCLVFV